MELGIKEGIKEGIKAFILDNLEEGKEEQLIIEKLKKRFQLSENEAHLYIEKCK